MNHSCKNLKISNSYFVSKQNKKKKMQIKYKMNFSYSYSKVHKTNV